MPFRSLYGAMAEQRAHFIDGYALGLRLHRDQRVRHDVAVLHDAPRRHVNRGGSPSARPSSQWFWRFGTPICGHAK